MTAGVAVLLKPHVTLKCFRAYFLPGRAKDLSAPGILFIQSVEFSQIPIPSHFCVFFPSNLTILVEDVAVLQ